jgi:hypothetical protein
MIIPMFGRCVAKQYLSVLEELTVKYSPDLHYILFTTFYIDDINYLHR